MDSMAAAPRRLLARRFAREVLTLQAGSFATMGLQFVTSVIIANLLNPAPFGVYYQARALLDLVAMLANLAVGHALITRLAAAHAQGDREESLRLMAYFLKVGLAVSLVEAGVGLLGGSYLGAVVLNDPEIGELARILFITPPLLVAFNMVILALQSTRQVKRLALLENGALMLGSLLNLGVVALGGGVSGLLYTVALTPVLTSGAALLVYRSTLPRMVGLPTLSQIVRAAPSVPFRRYFAFSALVSVDKNLANLIALAPTLLLGRLLASDAEVAYFKVASNLTLTLLAVPVSPISRNLYAKLAEVRARMGTAHIGKALVQVTLGGLAISAALTVGLMLAAPYVLQIYRPEYQPALGAMYGLGLRCATLGFAIGLGPLYQVLNAMKLAIASKVIPALVMVGVGSVLIESMGAAGAAWTVTITYLVGDVISACLAWWMLRRVRVSRAVQTESQPLSLRWTGREHWPSGTRAVLSSAIISLASLAGALSVPLTLLGRTTVVAVSRDWVLLLLGSWVALVAWAVLFALVLSVFRGFSTERSLFWAALCHIPLLLCFVLVAVLYQSDAAYHIYARSPYGDLFLRPVAVAYLLLAPSTFQFLRFAIRDRVSLSSALVILVIAGGSLFLRFNGIDWGLPGRFHPDEYSSKALHMRAINDMNPHFFTNPSLMIYAIYFAQSAVRPHSDSFRLITTFLGFPVDDPRGDYLLLVVGRIISALAGALTVGVVYAAGKGILGHRASAVAASVLAVSLLHVRNSHFATNDVVAAFLLVASFVFSSRIAAVGSRWDYCLAGLFGGLATTTKYTCIVFFVPLLVAHFSRKSEFTIKSLLAELWKPLISVCVSLVAFVAVTPYSVLSFREFQKDVQFQFSLGAEPAPGQFSIPTLLLALATLAQGLGLIPLVLALFGSVVLARCNLRYLLLLISVPMAFLISFSSQRYFFARFLIPVLPFLSLLAGYGLVRLANRWRKAPSARILLPALLAVMLLQGVVTSLQFNVLINQKDTRTLAADWIGANASPDADIAVEVHALMDNPYGWGPNCTDLRGPYWAHYIEVFWPDKAADLDKVISGKFDYVIVTSWGRELMQRHPNLPPSQLERYNNLGKWGALVATFGPGREGGDVDYAADDQYSPFWHLFDRARPGPTVEVYQMRQ